MKTMTVVAFLFACGFANAHTPETSNAERMAQTKIALARQFARIEGSNWTPEEVITRFGRPTNVETRGTTRTVWRYRFKNGVGFVEFKNGKAEWGYICDRERQTGVIEGVGEEFLPRAGDGP